MEIRSQIFKAYDKSRGLETGPYNIEMCKLDNPAEYSLYAYWARIYRDERIKEHYGITFDSFLDRPRYKINILLEGVKEINDRDAEMAAIAQKKLKESLELTDTPK